MGRASLFGDVLAANVVKKRIAMVAGEDDDSLVSLTGADQPLRKHASHAATFFPCVLSSAMAAAKVSGVKRV